MRTITQWDWSSLKEALADIEEPPTSGRQVSDCPLCGMECELRRGARSGFYIFHPLTTIQGRRQCQNTHPAHHATGEEAVEAWEALVDSAGREE